MAEVEPWPDRMDMIRQLREAAGLFAGAMPVSPKQAWEEAIERVGQLREAAIHAGMEGYMAEWTHAICDGCWDERHPARPTVVFAHAEVERCCFCGASTGSGIYVRADPRQTSCRGDHDQESQTTVL